MSKLIKKYYTITFSIIFGLFISIIPSVLNKSCVLAINPKTVISVLMLIIGFGVSYCLESINENNSKIKNAIHKILKLKTKEQIKDT